ncbi:MAG: hypothetical protein WD967_02045 [Candidatus Levyibacteriota bacterium]
MARRKSRLSRRSEKKTKQNLILSLLGITVVIFVVLKLGIPLLINFSLFIANQKDNSTEAAQSDNSSFIAPPVLDPLPVATNSARVSIFGTANPDQEIKIYVNNTLTTKLSAKKDGTFSLVEDIKKGSNTIRAKATVKDKDSGFSNPVTVTFVDSKPTIEITSPSDGQTFSRDQNKAPVVGKTSAESRITVNGFWAIVDDEGNFSYSLPLNNGENQIKIIATDKAGNTTEEEIRVTYNP